MTENSRFHQISITKSTTSEDSRQSEVEWEKFGALAPPTDFSLLTRVAEETFLVGGIIARIAATASSGWRIPDKLSPELKKLLDSLDQRLLFTMLYTAGNAFFERLKYPTGKTSRLKPFILSEIRVKLDKENKTLSYVQRPYSGGSESKFTDTEVVHIRLSSLTSRYYGASPIARASAQISLLKRIDDYYDGMFDSGFLWASILGDKDGKLTPKERDTLKQIIEDRLKGDKNAFNLLIAPADLSKLRLDEEVDATAFLEYRRDLIKSIAISLNIPYDILISDSSNRATAQASIETFNRDIIAPLQTLAIVSLRDALRDEYPEIDEVNFVPVDVSNQKEEMEVSTGYRKGGILTANEIREKIGYAPIEGGDILEIAPGNNTSSEIPPTTDRIEKSLKKAYASLNAG